jgi:hypothetical protein
MTGDKQQVLLISSSEAILSARETSPRHLYSIIIFYIKKCCIHHIHRLTKEVTTRPREAVARCSFVCTVSVILMV